MFEFSIGYSKYMDLLFTPRGTMTSSLASEGVLHFVIASTDDVYAWQIDQSAGRTRPMSGSFSTGTNSTYPRYWLQQDAERERRVLSIFTQSGGIVKANLSVKGNTNGQFNDEVVTLSTTDPFADPFYYSVHGQEAKE
jgi:hypothetical protein